jgi:hypothetical protein
MSVKLRDDISSNDSLGKKKKKKKKKKTLPPMPATIAERILIHVRSLPFTVFRDKFLIAFRWLDETVSAPV